MERVVDTNQRIYFDTNDRSLLASGNTNGMVNIWDMKSLYSNCGHEDDVLETENKDDNGKEEDKIEQQESDLNVSKVVREEEKLDPICSFKGGNDCINGVR